MWAVVMTFNIGEKAKQKGSMTMKVLLQREGRMNGEQEVWPYQMHIKAHLKDVSNPSLEIHMHASSMHEYMVRCFLSRCVILTLT